ncbi:MAG: tetratricopeptide repeat protein [Planctomycetales bacterium]|jgi:tetratricopeptide (TPR) repeat protein
MTPKNNAQTESVSTNRPVLAYHVAKLRTDGAIISGAVLSVAATLGAVVLLHENVNKLWIVPATAVALTAVLIPITVGVREIFRRRRAQLSIQPARSTGRPLALFAFSLVFGMIVTAGVSKNTLDSGVHYQIGQRQLENLDYLAAAETFSRFISVSPQHSIGYYKRGLAMYEAGQLDQAYADLKVAIDKKPRDWNSRVLFLGTLDRLGRDDELKTELERAEQLNPNARRSLNQLLESVEG